MKNNQINQKKSVDVLKINTRDNMLEEIKVCQI